MIRKWFNQKTLFAFILISMVLSTVFVIIRIIMAPSVAPAGEIGLRVKSDYTLMLLQCVAGTLALMLPSFIAKRLNIVIPSFMMIAYAIFLYCGVYLGEVRSFYYVVPHWDTILHTFSGFMLGALGFTLITFINKTDRFPLVLTPFFVAIFTFGFAVAIGVIWEIYEYSIDYFFHTNMQKFALEDGTQLIGQHALADTMKDLIVDCIGALVFSVIGYIAVKRDSKLKEKLALKVIKKRAEV
jgi:hypothetical protein